MSGECDKCGEHALECECILGLKNYYYIQMFFPQGYTTSPLCISEQIVLSSDDPVLNVAAERLSGNLNGIMVLFGLGKTMAFKYEKGKLKELT